MNYFALYTDFFGFQLSHSFLFPQILRDLGVRSMKLMTNNPAKYGGLKGYGLSIAGRVPLLTPITKENKRYLETKRAKMGHIYGSAEFNDHLTTSFMERNGTGKQHQAI